MIPPAVQAEIRAGGPSGIGVRELEAADWMRVVPQQDSRRADLLTDLDRGEAELLALAQEIYAGLVIVDERLARLHAKRLRTPAYWHAGSPPTGEASPTDLGSETAYNSYAHWWHLAQ